MEIDKLKQSINSNIEIVDNTFKSLGVKVAKCNVMNILDSGEVEIGVEVESINEDGSIPQDITVKIAVYDENDNLIGIEKDYLYENSFNGFDILWIYLNTENIASHIRRMKVFAQES